MRLGANTVKGTPCSLNSCRGSVTIGATRTFIARLRERAPGDALGPCAQSLIGPKSFSCRFLLHDGPKGQVVHPTCDAQSIRRSALSHRHLSSVTDACLVDHPCDRPRDVARRA